MLGSGTRVGRHTLSFGAVGGVWRCWALPVIWGDRSCQAHTGLHEALGTCRAKRAGLGTHRTTEMALGDCGTFVGSCATPLLLPFLLPALLCLSSGLSLSLSAFMILAMGL